MALKRNPLTGELVEVPNRTVIDEMASHVASGGKIVIQTTRSDIGSIYSIFGTPFRIIRECTAAEYSKENEGRPPHPKAEAFYEVEIAD